MFSFNRAFGEIVFRFKRSKDTSCRPVWPAPTRGFRDGTTETGTPCERSNTHCSHPTKYHVQRRLCASLCTCPVFAPPLAGQSPALPERGARQNHLVEEQSITDLAHLTSRFKIGGSVEKVEDPLHLPPRRRGRVYPRNVRHVTLKVAEGPPSGHSDELIDIILQRFLTSGPRLGCDPFRENTLGDG